MTNSSTSIYKQRLDKSVRPQDDFYGYVNNSWVTAHPIPDNESSWSAFSTLHDEARQHMHDIYEGLLPQQPAKNSIEQQARDLYHSGMHMDKQESKHLAIIDSYLKRIDKITNPKELSALLGELHKTGIDTPWRLIVDADDRDSTSHILRITQPSLSLPDRDYYLEDNDEMKRVRVEYQKHVLKVHSYFPALAPSAESLWQTIWNIELATAKAMRTRVELRDVEKNYNQVEFTELLNKYPAIDWQAYAQAVGWNTTARLSVDQPEYLAYGAQQMTERSLDDWKIYLKWCFLTEYYSCISNKFAELKFEFFGKVLGGAKEMQPQWKRVIAIMNYLIGEGVGQLYARKYFPESSKQQVLDLVEDVRAAYDERISQLDWMSEPTKKIARQKLANTKVLIGYPDKWRDYSALRITPDSYLENILAAEAFDSDYWLAKLHQPTSRDDWFMSPQTVNAYSDPNRVVICFPAAILQPPFFDPQAPYAANIGAIGAVIGHELTHGFDDQGYQFDAEGNVRVWQTPQERKAFEQRAQVIIDQADNFEIIPGLKLKGKLVIGEAIADLGGVELAHHALLHKVPDASVETADGLSADQVFFISFASTECGHTREQRRRELALRDPHPNEHFRVNGVLAHVDSFYDTYHVTPDDALYRPPEQRAKIW
jgi:putative endopeptidase